MAKSHRALASARTLLQVNDGDGACNRAYYAMFDAARAALLATSPSGQGVVAKTHSGLIAEFSLQLVKSGRFPMDLGKAFNKVEDLRLVADYKGDLIDESEALWAVQQAQAFVEAVDKMLDIKPSSSPDPAPARP